MRPRRRSMPPVLAALTVAGLALHVACGLFVDADAYDRDYGRVDAPDAALDVEPREDAVAPDAGGCDADVENDPLNCGACGRSCAGRACAAGRCATKHVYPGIAGTGIALSDAGIFVAGAGTVLARLDWSYNLGPYVPGGGFAFSVAADDAVFWTDLTGVTRSLPLDLSGDASILGETDSGVPAIVVKRTLSAPYWTVYGKSDAGAGVYYAAGALLEAADSAFGLADDDTYVYYGRRVRGGTIHRRQKAGAESIVVATAAGVPIQIAVDDFRVYFTDCEAGTVVSAGKEGASQTVLASGLAHPYAILEAGDYLYVSTVGTNVTDCLKEPLGQDEVGTIERISKKTGERLLLVEGQTTPLFLALRSDVPLLFWTSLTGAKAGVWNVPK